MSPSKRHRKDPSITTPSRHRHDTITSFHTTETLTARSVQSTTGSHSLSPHLFTPLTYGAHPKYKMETSYPTPVEQFPPDIYSCGTETSRDGPEATRSTAMSGLSSAKPRRSRSEGRPVDLRERSSSSLRPKWLPKTFVPGESRRSRRPLSFKQSDNEEPTSGNVAEVTVFTGCHGPYQQATFRFGLLAAFVLPLQAMVPQILMSETDHWCAPHSRNMSAELWKEQMIPKDIDGKYSKCEMYSELPNGTVKKVPCKDWVYAKNPYGYTLVQEWNLVCDRAWLLVLSSSIFLVGGLTSLVISGPASDKLGRKPVALFSLIFSQVCSIVIVFCTDVYVFIVLRFFLGAALTTLYATSVIIILEVLAPGLRSIYGIAVLLGYVVGDAASTCLSLIGFNWHIQQQIGLVPTFMMISSFYSLTESPRWLIAVGRADDAEVVILHAAHMNGQNLMDVRRQWSWSKKQITRGTDRGVSLRIVKEVVLENAVNVAILYYCWGALSLAYYTITLRIRRLDKFQGIFVLVAGLLEVPALLGTIVAVARIGRRWSLAAALWCTGCAHIVAVGITEGGTKQLAPYRYLGRGVLYQLCSDLTAPRNKRRQTARSCTQR
ncbi:solute carrier family 22 member 13-like isoform X2 [Ornithodoros turicata]|uniref:solute carrier family 22 member 13-like isoform X2 n=1 Tax=Ornithodoros turicata TaxID=34597 RepID=UPI0031392AFE